MKKLLLLVTFLQAFIFVRAQKKQNVYFFKNNGKEVFVKDSADFTRVIQEPDSGSSNFVLLEFYKDGKRKTMGTVSKFSPKLVYEGQRLSFYKNGAKKSSVNYQDNKLVGLGFYYFQNGKMQKTLEYISPASAEQDESFSPSSDIPMLSEQNKTSLPLFKLIYQADSLGKVMVEDGNGHLITQDIFPNRDVTIEGDYKSGFKDGTWTAKDASGNYEYKEQFEAGKFISGESKKDGMTYIYTKEEELPEFKGGIKQFYRYLSTTIRYPADAVRARIMGKVFLSFVVEKDGTLANIVVVSGVNPSIDEEAMRVLTRSPKWSPGKQHGMPVRVKYNVPITFSLSR